MGHIIAIFHHGCHFNKGQYVSKLKNIVFSIDKDHFSLTELKSYVKDIGYDEVDAFFTEEPITHNFVKLESDSQLYNFVKDLWSGSSFKLFLKHVSHTEHGINGVSEVEQPLEEEKGDSLDFEEDDLDDVPHQDDSEVDEELRAFRQKLREEKKKKLQRKKKRTKKPLKDQGVELGEVGIDKRFENIFTNKAAKYNGKLGGDEVFIDSSDELSEDSDEELDVLAQPGVDLPSRRKSNKLRYDSSSSIYFFELGMIFESATQLERLKPNEPHRVRGLEVAVEVLLPNAERRMCARHIWANWQKRWRGEERRNFFWRCAKASFEVKLRDEFEYMGKLGDRICETLLGYNKKYWCRALFSEISKCDMIVGSRHKSVISMLEDIRHRMMDRHGDMIKFADTWISDISPMARLILEENKEIGRTLRVNWNHDIGFEIQEREYRHIIDMTRKTYSCRVWQLRGIPCQHAVCALYHIGQEPEDYVEYWYRKDTFLSAYKYFLQPISNIVMWPDTNNSPVEPPEVKPMPRRPGRCRRKDKDEPRKKKWEKTSKNGVKMSCFKCHQVGHNKELFYTSNFVSLQPSQLPTQQPSRPFQQPPVRQPSIGNASSLCADTSKVKGRKKKQPTARATSSSTAWTSSSSVGMPLPSSVERPPASSVGRKRTRDVEFGVYTDIQTGRQVINVY
ncbi:hypothetical protein H5410_056257 [Solanum commersonii]|uniref:SWIM-type domain-containing protein n=1 Tax=Solanum commersonii TaxID=4109 RepID=A0A9J5WJS0_SOLCO|nr:hypothetical protein H5410_056257 [Solanum commersonii]